MSVASLLFLGVVCAASLVRVIHCQDACEKITTNDLGRSNMLQNTGLVAATLTPTGEGSNGVDVRILNMTIVCEAQHEMQDRYRYTSVVVSFNCVTTDDRVPECNDSSVVLTEQFDFGCVSGTWSPVILTVSTAARSANPTATLSTGLDTGCILCVNPSNSEAAFLPSPVDNVTHCVGEFLDSIVGTSCYHKLKTILISECTNCTVGLQRCFYQQGTTNEDCCNYFHQGACVAECPSQFGPVANMECGKYLSVCSLESL